MFDEKNRRPPDTYTFAQNPVEPDYEAYDNNDFDDDQHDNSGTNLPDEEPFMPNYHEVFNHFKHVHME